MQTLLKIIASVLTVWLLVISFTGIANNRFGEPLFWLQYLVILLSIMLCIAYLKKYRP